MIDSNSQFFATLTAVGEAKQANATALGIPWTFKEMAVGDANGSDPVPNKTQTKLINEWRRAPVNQVRTDPTNPNIIITEQVIPPDVGGHWIREIGLFDADGDLVAVANCAPTFKPLLAQGTGKTQIIRMNFIVSNTAQIVLKIDPAVVLATRQYVDDSLATALPANKAAGTYRQVTIDKRGVVLSGTNPTTVAGYGITDAYTKPETTAAIQQAVAALVASAPGTLDTLKELADALGNDPNFATTMTNALAAKANKATTLGGYGIVDGATKSDLNSAVSGLLPKAGGIVSGPIYLANGTGDSPEVVWKTPELEVYADVVNRTLRFFSYFNGQTEFPLVIDVPGKSASFFGSTAWHSGNFNPQEKANKSTTLAGYGITDAYSKGGTYSRDEVNELVKGLSALPVGAMVPFPKGTAAPGFLETDGSVQSVTTFPDLAAYLGGAFNRGDEGAGNFRLPDTRGEFLRGWDHGRGIDSGRSLGSAQADAVQNIVASVSSDSGAAYQFLGEGTLVTTGAFGVTTRQGNQIADGAIGPVAASLTFDASRSVRTSYETRPRNLSVMWCIKAWNAPVNQGTLDVAALATQVVGFSARTSALEERPRGVGDGQSWRDVTASRVSGTVYTNTTGRPIQVVVSFTTGGVTARVDGVNVTYSAYHASFVVPAGSTYSVILGSPVNLVWAELRT
ncbi:phage tail-collar fiber domain-containing protein [Pseudomonas piscis]|uniref:phage tail-collar fiber domain-containing protein n=1 Tax=Pseudomonas piscis TaxID=2614538 RepID=UPI0003B54B15|nr:phage tail protein [Pseudomonas piscis]ERO61155.1 hypothetical protein P308_10485 [Pseudomonas piscis]